MTDKDKSSTIWERQYSNYGSGHIHDIFISAHRLKPLIEEIGWQCLDLDSDDIKIFIEFKKDK